MKKLTAFLLILVMVLTVPVQLGEHRTEAASIYISVNDYAKALIKELGLMPVDGNEETGYVTQLKHLGIINDGDFIKYTNTLTRGDMLVLLNRADDYLNDTKVDQNIIKQIIDKRITDIDRVAASKKDDVAQGFMKGFLKGYSNGEYSSNRLLKVDNKIVKEDALNCLKMLKNKSLRAKISPDGQLIRTTKLPNNAYMFPYILASYPNSYYEAQLMFEGVTQRLNGKIIPLVSPDDYTYPKDIANSRKYGVDNFQVAKAKFMDDWIEKVYTRVWNIFNVDYHTINDNWVETIAQTDSEILNSTKMVYDCLNRYVSEMKKNETIVECSKVAIDSSAVYYYKGMYYFRCYIRFKITSTKTKSFYTLEETNGSVWGPYNRVLFSRSGYVNLENIDKNQWIDGIFDIGICAKIYGNDGSMYGVGNDNTWSPYLFRVIERN